MAKKFEEMFTEEERYDLQQTQPLNEIDLKAVAGGLKAVAGAAVKGAATAVANKALGMVGLPNLAAIKGIFDTGYKAKVAQEQKVEAQLAPGLLKPQAQTISKGIKAQIGKDIDTMVKQYTQTAVKLYNDDKAKRIQGFKIADSKGQPTNVPPEVWVISLMENASKSLFDQYKSKYADPTKSMLTKAMIDAKFPPAPATPPAAPGAKPGAAPAAPGTPAAAAAPAAGAAPAAAAAPAATK
jgi:hypothetical protein